MNDKKLAKPLNQLNNNSEKNVGIGVTWACFVMVDKALDRQYFPKL